MRDITERKRTELAQRTSDERYRALFEYAPDGIVIADHRSCYIDANASICRMLGYTRDELIGLTAADIVVPEEHEHISPALASILGRSSYQREWQFRRKDGSVFTADVIATEMPDGNLLAMIYMSGYTDEAIVRHGVLLPGIAFLHKPFTADDLGRKIREELDR